MHISLWNCAVSYFTAFLEQLESIWVCVDVDVYVILAPLSFMHFISWIYWAYDNRAHRYFVYIAIIRFIVYSSELVNNFPLEVGKKVSLVTNICLIPQTMRNMTWAMTMNGQITLDGKRNLSCPHCIAQQQYTTIEQKRKTALQLWHNA